MKKAGRFLLISITTWHIYKGMTVNGVVYKLHNGIVQR